MFLPMEEKILKKIEVQNYYKRRIQVYQVIRKVGFIFLIGLCLLFIWVSGMADQDVYVNTLYMLFGPVVILSMITLPFGIIPNRLSQKKD